MSIRGFSAYLVICIIVRDRKLILRLDIFLQQVPMSMDNGIT